MQQGSAERRRGRRVQVEAPLLIRRAGEAGKASSQQETADNISLAGVYFTTGSNDPYALNDVVIASVAIPEPQRRIFPFTRVAGRSRVVRIDELPQEPAAGSKRVGIALEFGDDVTALTAIPARG